MNEYLIQEGNQDDLDLVKHLWEKLCRYHCDLSVHFRDRFKDATWEKRKRRLLDGSRDILLNYVVEKESGQMVGYCISTIAKEDGTVGEVSSIYVEETYRRSGLGTDLILRALEWLQLKETKIQKLLVGVGNEEVLEFYKQFGFVPFHIELQRVEKKGLERPA